MSLYRTALRYLKHLLLLKTKIGFGIHSPFIFKLTKFIQKSYIDKKSIKKIELLRNELLKNKQLIKVFDYGSGSKKVTKNGEREIRSIAKHSLKNKRQAILLYKLSEYFSPTCIIELGTSLGITTSYIATASPNSKIITLEGCPNISEIAKDNFNKLHINNVELITGNFNNTLPELIQKQKEVNFVFFDGNHTKEATLRYFNIFLQKTNNETVFIFDDIYYNSEMEEAWNIIKQDTKVTASIDFFHMGIVFFKKELSKENFKIFY